MLEILFPGIKEGQYTLAIIISCISVALWLLVAAARWRMFTKMGEKGWKAFVPFYGLYIMYSKCWSTKAAWNCILGIIVSALFEFGAFKTDGEIATILCSIGELMVAVYMLYLSVRINFRVAKAFGHGAGSDSDCGFSLTFSHSLSASESPNISAIHFRKPKTNNKRYGKRTAYAEVPTASAVLSPFFVQRIMI